MHSATVFAALFAASAIASPFHNLKHADLHKRYEVVEVKTVVDTVVDTVTVMAGQGQPEAQAAPTSSPPVYPSPAQSPTSTSSSSSSSSSAPPSPPPSSNTGSTGSTGSSGSAGGSNPYQEAILGKHKTLRDNFGHPALVWNDSLASLAEFEAKAANCQMAHNLNDENGNSVAMGQNLAMGTDRDGPNGNWDQISGQVQDWYNENTGYAQISDNYASPPDSSAMASGEVDGKEILHFTQLVWKASEQIGCYTVTGCDAGGEFGPQSLTFCNYWPQGNIADENDSNQYQSYLQNVGQPVSGSY